MPVTEHRSGPELPRGIALRHPEAADHARVQEVLGSWWDGMGGEEGAAQRRLLVPRLFFQHFTDTSFLAEDDAGALRAFLVGFVSQTDPRTAYVHFVGVHPDGRGGGLGSALYGRFFALARERGCARVKCITSPVNTGSLAYHTRLGFRLEPGDAVEDGVPVHRDYDGPGLDRICFIRDL